MKKTKILSILAIGFIPLFTTIAFANDNSQAQVEAVANKYAPMFTAMHVAYGIGECNSTTGVEIMAAQGNQPAEPCIVIRTQTTDADSGWKLLFKSVPFQLEGVWVSTPIYIGTPHI